MPPAVRALRGPVPALPRELRLEDAGDAKPAWITLPTTEHYNLQMQRVATISESNGRASVFLGLVAFIRCLKIAIDDWEFVTRITRLRHSYHQLVPDLAPLMAQAVADEGTVVMLSARWQLFQKLLSVAGSVAVITGVVLGGDVGVIVSGVTHSLAAAIGAGTAAGALILGWATWYQWGRWCQASPPPPEPSRGR
ncbi:MAG TPA: hypothetical protein VH089_10345 [Streptosporangiaceae bacterium]|nr:hypothetical protein [Streptosporangiaceae bacterium]